MSLADDRNLITVPCRGMIIQSRVGDDKVDPVAVPLLQRIDADEVLTAAFKIF